MNTHVILTWKYYYIYDRGTWCEPWCEPNGDRYRESTGESTCERTYIQVPVQKYIKIPKVGYRYRIYKYQSGTGTRTCEFSSNEWNRELLTLRDFGTVTFSVVNTDSDIVQHIQKMAHLRAPFRVPETRLVLADGRRLRDIAPFHYDVARTSAVRCS